MRQNHRSQARHVRYQGKTHPNCWVRCCADEHSDGTCSLHQPSPCGLARLQALVLVSAFASTHLPTPAVADTRQLNYAPVVQLGSAIAVGADRTEQGYARQRAGFRGKGDGRELGQMTHILLSPHETVVTSTHELARSLPADEGSQQAHKRKHTITLTFMPRRHHHNA